MNRSDQNGTADGRWHWEVYEARLQLLCQEIQQSGEEDMQRMLPFVEQLLAFLYRGNVAGLLKYWHRNLKAPARIPSPPRLELPVRERPAPREEALPSMGTSEP